MSPALRYGLFAAACIGGAVVASCYVEPAAPIYGHERDDVACSDGIDNDADYLVDCYDPDCLAESTLCGEIVPEVPIDEPEPNGIGRDAIATCRDRIDNDNDGQFDCGDQECRDIPETCCVIENTNELCSDGIDNDSNGFADCADFGCSQGQFVTVCVEDTVDLCSDDIDNDANGFVDCNDRDCFGLGDCPLLMESDDSACSDGKDNDKDGDTDCNDADCNGVGPCPMPPPEDDLEACSDGDDNDRDGFVDCDDFSCSDPDDTNPDREALLDLCVPEDTVEACTNGIDDNNNGFIDCDDFSCARADLPEVRVVCDESWVQLYSEAGNPSSQPFPSSRVVAEIEAQCSNGIDEDGDGFIDCEDWQCSHNPLIPDFCDGPKVCR